MASVHLLEMDNDELFLEKNARGCDGVGFIDIWLIKKWKLYYDEHVDANMPVLQTSSEVLKVGWNAMWASAGL